MMDFFTENIGKVRASQQNTSFNTSCSPTTLLQTVSTDTKLE